MVRAVRTLGKSTEKRVSRQWTLSRSTVDPKLGETPGVENVTEVELT